MTPHAKHRTTWTAERFATDILALPATVLYTPEES